MEKIEENLLGLDKKARTLNCVSICKVDEYGLLKHMDLIGNTGGCLDEPKSKDYVSATTEKAKEPLKPIDPTRKTTEWVFLSLDIPVLGGN
jgi:hypothetical protein